MAVTPFQSRILGLLAQRRRESRESYVAGGIALNLLIQSSRKSRDIDLFHDTDEALFRSWSLDREMLEADRYSVRVLREGVSFVEAVIEKKSNRTAMQWARDSAYRFFPLIEDSIMGLALHPFDLATNKVLAMAGRLEARDWIDVLNCDRQLQSLGYLVWAACGKDPGYNPQSLLSLAGRSHYSQAEVDMLDFDGNSPSAAVLGTSWHGALETAAKICASLPADKVGTCVISVDGELFRGDPENLRAALANDNVAYHEGSIGGSWPRLIPTA